MSIEAASTERDVVVAGGGPTGLWLACELALTNVRVAVLEKLAEPTGLSKALGLQSRSMEMLEYRGILHRFTAGNPMPPFLNFGMFPLDLRRIDFPHPFGVVIPQARVEALLEERAKELGVEIRRGHELTGLSQDARGVKAEVRAASGTYELAGQYLAGCDGGHSTVRKQSGIAFPGLEPTIVGRMGDVKLAPGMLERLKQNVPELGGREFGIARTKTGNFAIVAMGSDVYRIAAIEWDQPAIDREAQMTLDELQAAIRRVITTDLAISDPVWLSRATDSSRLAERYRDGRVFLAGDAAHVHWAYGGKGLQTGLQDAGNLGWKLAAEIHGWAPAGLLDTYHSERHPIGERLMTLTRAQEALARPGEHVTALRELFGRLLTQEETFRLIAEEITDIDICYQMGTDNGNGHRLLGRWAPNLALHVKDSTVHVAELMRSGKGVLVDLTGTSMLCNIIAPWADRVEVISAVCYERPINLDAMLVRPDGYVAWVLRSGDGDEESRRTLRAALQRWFGGER
ncbi:MAG: FAD-dependent monooxygenase [Acidobacteriaceae bacterium]|nr:FAD-dependent monooxygenase [Acidobacteriaceae bacterium]